MPRATFTYPASLQASSCHVTAGTPRSSATFLYPCKQAPAICLQAPHGAAPLSFTHASKLLPRACRDPKKQRALGELFESLQSRAEGAATNGRVAEAGAAAQQPQSLAWVMLYLVQHYDLQRRTGGLGLPGCM